MPLLVRAPTRIPVPGGKVIDEYVGTASTGQAGLPGSVSVAHMMAPGGWSEPYQAPDFGEVTLVLDGLVVVEHDEGRLEAHAGQAVVTAPGERVRYSAGPGGAEYVAVCLPAFTPESAHRDDG